jgi:multiple sugar transport system substrate-binding protein
MDRLLSRRGFLSGSVLFVGGVALSACSSDPLSSSGSGGDAQQAKITINHWYHEYGEEGTQDAVMRYAAEYSKANPDVAVKVTWVPGDYGAKWRSALLTDEGPDVYEVNEVPPDMVQSNQVVALDDILGAEKSDFSASVMDPLSYGGKTYGIPIVVDIMLLYYRKSLLDKAGVTPPQTFPELLDAAKKLTSGKQKGLFLANDGIGHSRFVLPWSNGAKLLDGRKVAFDDDKTAEALLGLRELHKAKVLLEGYATDWYDPGAFTSGAAAMAWGGMWALPAIKEALGDDFDVMAWPAFGSSGTPAVNLGGWVQVVNGKSKQLEEAKKYVQWLWVQKTDLQQDWNLSYGFHLPPRGSVAAQAQPLTTGQAKNAVDAANQYGQKTPNLWSQEVRTPYEDAVVSIAKNNADPAKTLKDAAERTQAIIDKLPVL